MVTAGIISRPKISKGVMSCTLGMLKITCWIPKLASLRHSSITSWAVACLAPGELSQGRFFDGSIIPPDFLAVSFEDIQFGPQHFVAKDGGEVAGISVFGYQAQGFLFATPTDEDGRVRF